MNLILPNSIHYLHIIKDRKPIKLCEKYNYIKNPRKLKFFIETGIRKPD